VHVPVVHPDQSVFFLYPPRQFQSRCRISFTIAWISRCKRFRRHLASWFGRNGLLVPVNRRYDLSVL